MPPSLFINRQTGLIFSLALILGGSMALRGQEAAPTPTDANEGWQHFDWLNTDDDQRRQAAAGGGFTATAGQYLQDPYTVLSTGSLWQDNYGAVYTRRIADQLSLSYETSATMLDDDSMDLSRGQKVGLQVQPLEELTLRCDVHDSTSDTGTAGISAITYGTGFSAESHLPFNEVLTLGLNTDRTRDDTPSGSALQTNAYDAQLLQPLGRLPVTAVFKGHYEETSADGSLLDRMPSLEQALVWKPHPDTTLQTGLRQQQYQIFPGDKNDFNETLFADWSQSLAGDVTWHSYAEVLNSRTTEDTAPIVPIASGANGTPQAADSPGSSPLAMPSLNSQSVTFSTGPSFKLQKDLSASLEYSSRWDQVPVPGSAGQEQRFSVSVKGSF